MSKREKEYDLQTYVVWVIALLMLTLFLSIGLYHHHTNYMTGRVERTSYYTSEPEIQIKSRFEDSFSISLDNETYQTELMTVLENDTVKIYPHNAPSRIIVENVTNKTVSLEYEDITIKGVYSDEFSEVTKITFTTDGLKVTEVPLKRNVISFKKQLIWAGNGVAVAISSFLTLGLIVGTMDVYKKNSSKRGDK